MRRIYLIPIVLLITVSVYAANTEVQDMVELTAIASTDVFYVVDDPAGTPASRKITALNLFDMIDTFAELNTIVADKTLVNEEDAAVWDALGTFNLGITITTGDPFTLGVVRWDNGSDKMDGEQIADNTIDVDSLDWGAFTDLGESGVVIWGNIAEGELADSTVIGADIKDDTVDSDDYAAGSIDDEHIADNVIQEPALNITNAGEAGIDNYLLSYNHAGTNFTWVVAGAGDMTKAVYDSGESGGVDVLTTVDSTYASDYVLLTGTAVGTDAPKTDGALTYDATSGTLAATEFSGGGSGLTLASTDLSDTAALLYETELDDFAELDAQIADKALVNLADGGTFTGNLIANGNLSVGNAGTTAGVLTLLEDDDDGAHFASFMVPALAANTVYTLPPDDGDDTEVLQTNGSGTLTWVANAGGGATAWDDIGDPDAAATIDFATYTQTIDIGKSDSGGGSGLVLDVTGLGAGTDEVIALEITTAANDDTDYIPIAVYDDSGADNDLVFQVDSKGGMTLSEGGYLSQESGAGYLNFKETNGDEFIIYLSADTYIMWTDGPLNLRGQYDSDTIVNILGKDAGEKGILRVLSDGDDNYIELYHDDTDGHIITDTGDIHIEPDGGDVVISAATITTATTTNNIKSEPKHLIFNLWNPNALYDNDTQVCIWKKTDAAITITKIELTCDADPDTELDVDLKWADAFIGLANAAVIDECTTTNGTTSISAGFDDATVASGKCVYVEWQAEPDAAITQVSWDITWDYD